MAHFAKYTAAAAGHLSKHYERAKDEKGEYIKFGNKDIDTDRTPENYNLAPDREGGQQAFIKQRLSEVKLQKRDDVKTLCDWVVTLPKGDYTPERERAFFVETYRFLSEKYGEKNVVSAFVHKDEEQPHMHFAFIPVVPDRKWNEKHPDRQREKVSAKECVTKADLEQFHTEYQQRLDSCFGRDVFPVQNGETIKGAANVAEIKAARAKAAFDEQAAFYEGQLENARQSLSEAHQTLEAVKVEVDTLQAEKNALQDEIGGLRGILEGLREKIAELAELLWQVPIQKIHHRTDPIQEPIREAALLLQLLFQALHLYQQLSVLVFKPLPLLSLLQLFFCRGDFLLKPLIFFLQLLHFLFRCRTSDCCRLQFLYLFYGNAFHSSCQRLFWLYGLQIRLDLLNRL